MQLPAQSYAEYQGCGAWQSSVEWMQRRPRSVAATVTALLLLLLIVLCATLVPAARWRHQNSSSIPPAFLAPPTVATTGATWLDLAVQLDRPGLLAWMVFRQADLGTLVPGGGLGGVNVTLAGLILGGGVQGASVYAASAPASSLHLGDAPQQPGLQHLAVACGWAPMSASAGTSTSVNASSAARLSILSAGGGGALASAACTAAAAGAPGGCVRCPMLQVDTAYTLVLVAASAEGAGGGSSSIGTVQVVNATTATTATGAAAANVAASSSVVGAAPYADNATATSFDLHFQLNSPGARGRLEC